jgi:peptidoglycan/LPS O-acetylase OafA/YrhL
VMVVVSFAIAAASYYLVERPILRFKYRRIRV